MLDSCARTKDAVRFARSCLTVCHNRAVEAIKYVFDHGLRSELGCRLLGVILVKHTVESKLALIVTRPQEGDSHLIRVRVYALYASLRSLTQLIVQEGSHAHNHVKTVGLSAFASLHSSSI